MRRFFAILMLGLCAAAGAQAQHYFNVRDPLHSFSTILTSVQPRGGKYYCTGLTWDSSNYIGNNQAWDVWGVRFAVFDEGGVKLRDTVYQRPFQTLGLAQGRSIDPWPSTAHLTPDGGFLVAAYSYDYDTPTNVRAALIKLDTMGRCTMFREYEKPFCQSTKGSFSHQIRDLKSDGHGGWLLLTRPLCQPGSPSARYDYALTKLDSAFNVVWDKLYTNGSNNSVVTKVVVEADGYLLAGGRNNLYQTSIGFTHRAQFIKTDMAGNELWRWESDPAKKTSLTDVLRTPDGGYLYCGGTGEERLNANGQSAEVWWKGWIEKLDAARNVQWNKTTSHFFTAGNLTEQRVLRLLPNGDIAMAGSVVDTTLTTYIRQRGSLMRLAPDGTIRWQRQYSFFPADTFQNFVHDMKPATDGGFVMVGQSIDPVYPYQYPTQQGWIIKVDSNGCASNNDPQCWPTAIALSLTASPSITIFPNPVHETLRISSTHPLQSDARIVLSDLSGRAILSATLLPHAETEVSTEALPPGMYLYRVVSGGEVVSRGKVMKQ